MQEKCSIPDQKLEALLNRLRKKIPDTKCPSGNKITRLCTNPKCKNALRCGDKNCKDCGKAIHKVCSSIPLEQITDMLNDCAENCQKYIVKLFKIEQQFIESIHRRQKQFIDNFDLTLDVKYCLTIQKIYKGGKFNQISGEEVNDLCQAIQMDIQDRKLNQKLRFEDYTQKLKGVLNTLQNIRKQCAFKSADDCWLNFHSKVLQAKGDMLKDVVYLRQVLNYPKKIELLFRASQYDFRAEQFHKKCDNIEDTLVLIRNQHGKTLGGYTHYKWNHRSGYVQDHNRKTFLLSMDLHQKIVPTKDVQLIYCNSNYGPSFGQSYTHSYYGPINISDQCNIKKSQFGFPFNYAFDSMRKYQDKNTQVELIMGPPTQVLQYKYKVEQYEVYRVIYK